MELRKATMADALDLLNWKNDLQTIKFSIVTNGIITWSNHCAWLERRLKKPGFYIITDGKDKCGDLRFDFGEETEISVRINPKFRGQWIATQAVALGCEMYAETLVAKIVEGNLASLNVFTRNGFVFKDYVKGEKNYYVLKRV